MFLFTLQHYLSNHSTTNLDTLHAIPLYLLYFGDMPNLVSCAFSKIPILNFPLYNSENFILILLVIIVYETKLCQQNSLIISLERTWFFIGFDRYEIIFKCVFEILKCWSSFWLSVPRAEHDLVEGIWTALRFGHPVACLQLRQNFTVSS